MKYSEIKSIVDEYYNINISKKTRQSNYVEARFMYFTLCMELGDKKTLASIGASVQKDHATVLHGIRTLKGHMSYDKALNDKYQDLYKMVSKRAGLKDYADSLYHSMLNKIYILTEENKELRSKILKYERV